MGAATSGRELAKRLLAQEVGGSDRKDVIGATVAVCQNLYLEVGQFIGPDGFRALLARAVHLARPEFPFLDLVRIDEFSFSDCLPGLAESISQRAETEVTEGVAAVLGGFVDLLSTFIGQDLALRMIHRRWPDLRTHSDDGEEGKQ